MIIQLKLSRFELKGLNFIFLLLSFLLLIGCESREEKLQVLRKQKEMISTKLNEQSTGKIGETLYLSETPNYNLLENRHDHEVRMRESGFSGDAATLHSTTLAIEQSQLWHRDMHCKLISSSGITKRQLIADVADRYIIMDYNRCPECMVKKEEKDALESELQIIKSKMNELHRN